MYQTWIINASSHILVAFLACQQVREEMYIYLRSWTQYWLLMRSSVSLLTEQEKLRISITLCYLCHVRETKREQCQHLSHVSWSLLCDSIHENVNTKTSCENLNWIHLVENWVECHTLWSWQRTFTPANGCLDQQNNLNNSNCEKLHYTINLQFMMNMITAENISLVDHINISFYNFVPSCPHLLPTTHTSSTTATFPPARHSSEFRRWA
jgi:hypothetical protein